MEEEGLEKAGLDEIPVETAPTLEESETLARLQGGRSSDEFCPLCSRLLSGSEATRCHHCGADIEAAKEAIRMSGEIISGIESALRQGDRDAAERGLMQLDQINLNQKPKANFLRSKLCFLEKEYAKALALANTILDDVEVEDELQEEVRALVPEWQDELRKKIESQEHYNFALSRIRDGLLEEAKEHLLKAIDLAPHLPENFLLLGKACVRTRSYEDGKYYLERYLLLDEENPAALELLSKIEAAKRMIQRQKRKQRDLAIIVISVSVVTIIIFLLSFISQA